MPPPITDIFFDLDHTLWDFERNSALAFRSLFDNYAPGLAVDDFLTVYTPINESYWEAYRHDRIDKQGLRHGRLADAFAALGLSFSVADIDRMADDYIAFLPKNNFLIEGAKEILQYLSSSYKLHIITNGFEEVQGQKLTGSGIAHYFKTLTTSEAAGAKKPHSKIFETALQAAAATPQNSLMIGDSWEADIVGAQQAGLQAIWLAPDNPFTDRQGTIIGLLSELKLIL